MEPYLPGFSEQGAFELDLLEEIGTEPRVLVFNDEVHTFEEVIQQIIMATGCSEAHAEQCTYEIHYRGKATVFTGELVQCLRVSSVLEEIELLTQVEM